MSAIDDIAAERCRQTEVEGWTPDHDDQHVGGELARAAACYALGTSNLVRAGALIVAEIERLDRAAAKQAA